MKRLLLCFLVLALADCQAPRPAGAARVCWTPGQANAWYAKQPWLVGCNFTPSTAINQLEMWQAETWDPQTIDRELGWAHELGFTSVRVFLHDLVWKNDRPGLLRRMEKFLALAERHKIGVMFVLFDSVWDPFPKAGKQREPYPHRHNSGWVQSPGQEILKSPARQDELRGFVQGVIGHFRNDRRIQVWDIFNEPDNPVPQYRDVELKNKAEVALQLLTKVFVWARAANPSQPLSSGVWLGHWGDAGKLSATERCQLEESDIITFHTYDPVEGVRKCVQNLRRYGRPILCTEFMARPRGSRFDPVLGFLKEQRVGGYCWGFVNGKTQTIYPWDSWDKEYASEPTPWFHDILRRDGTPYDAGETAYIRSLTRSAR